MNQDERPPLLSVPQPPPENCALAVWSLVLGILSLTCFWLLTAIPAVICGHIAYSRIKRSNGVLTGGGLAVGGLITGYISIALTVVFVPLLAAIAIPNFVKARDVAQINACVNNLRQLDGAKQMWALEHHKEGSEVPTHEDLAAYLKNRRFTCPSGGFYTLNSVDEAPTCSVPRHELP